MKNFISAANVLVARASRIRTHIEYACGSTRLGSGALCSHKRVFRFESSLIVSSFISFFVSSLITTSAYALEFASPVDCKIGVECFIQNYVDVDPSPEWQDFSCGKLSYNGHDGTDFRVKNFVEMERGVNVLAAADGIVMGVRDGIEDNGMKDPQYIKNKECGNGVMVNHANGWQSQYCHMKKGSVRVFRGQRVKTGDALGQIGYSGQTAFPHLHITIRKDGKPIDPFTQEFVGQGTCALTPRADIWKDEARIAYIPTALLGAGFSTQAPTADGVRHGQFNESSMTQEAPLLVAWVDIMGIRTGDKLHLKINAPDGSVFFQKEEVYPAPKAVQFTFAGRKRQGSTWPVGNYTGSATLVRDGKEIFRQPLTIRAD